VQTRDTIYAKKAAALELVFVHQSNATSEVSLTETSLIYGLRMAREIPKKSISRSLLLVLLLLGFVPLFTGCATQKPKPWEHKRPGWWETNIDSDDRAFYHDFFLGR
jgi:hypothetical protein